MKAAFCAMSALGLVGCATAPAGIQAGPPQKIANALTVCGGGLSSGTKASLAATLQKSGGNVTAEVKQEMRAIFLSDAKVTESNAVELYRLYDACMTRLLG